MSSNQGSSTPGTDRATGFATANGTPINPSKEKRTQATTPKTPHYLLEIRGKQATIPGFQTPAPMRQPPAAARVTQTSTAPQKPPAAARKAPPKNPPAATGNPTGNSTTATATATSVATTTADTAAANPAPDATAQTTGNPAENTENAPAPSDPSAQETGTETEPQETHFDTGGISDEAILATSYGTPSTSSGNSTPYISAVADPPTGYAFEASANVDATDEDKLLLDQEHNLDKAIETLSPPEIFQQVIKELRTSMHSETLQFARFHESCDTFQQNPDLIRRRINIQPSYLTPPRAG
jgi:hypothetical protein